MDSVKNALEPVAWIMQILTGSLMVGFVAYHFYVTHMVGHEALSYGNVISRLGELAPFYVILILLVTFHAFNGVRAIILDTNFGARNRRVVNAVTLSLFVLFALYGLLLLHSLTA